MQRPTRAESRSRLIASRSKRQPTDGRARRFDASDFPGMVDLMALTDDQRALLEFLLAGDFAGSEELRTQARTVRTSGSSCDCGCASFFLNPDHTLPPAPVAETVPIEAHGSARGGSAVQVLVFVRDGYLYDLEIVTCDGPPARDLPRPADLEVSHWSLPDEQGVRTLLNP
jgi:hypothetical protein